MHEDSLTGSNPVSSTKEPRHVIKRKQSISAENLAVLVNSNQLETVYMNQVVLLFHINPYFVSHSGTGTGFFS